MSNAVEFNSLTANDEVKVKMDPPPRVSQKPSDEEVAKYSKTRLVLVVIFGILIIGMVVAAVVIIIVSPKCPPKKAPIDREWFKDDIAYQINLKNFKDSNGDGKGDLKGLTDSLDYLNGLGVKILRLNSIYKSPNQNNDIQDYLAIDPVFGNMSDFEELVKKAHDKGMKIVVDFVPNHTSKKHNWFVESAKSTKSEKRGWYIWRGTANNWPSVSGGSAWEKDSTTNELYLHQFEDYKPDLNLRNDSVVEELKNVLKFWMKKGVDGFTARDVQYLLENSSFSDEVEKSNYSPNGTTYDMTEHGQTFGLAGNVELVKKFRDTLNEADSHKLFILDLKGTPAQVAQFYDQSDIPSFTGLIGLKKPAEINKTVTEYLKSLKKGQWPNFVVSDCKTDFKSLTNAMNVLLLTLPGTPSSCVGMELGTNKVDWKEAENQEKDGKSTYNVFKAVAKLRKNPAFNSTDFKAVQAGSQVLGYVRGNKYLVAINFDENKWKTDNFKELSGSGTVKFDSKFVLNGTTVDINRDVVLEGGQAVIIELDHFKFM